MNRCRWGAALLAGLLLLGLTAGGPVRDRTEPAAALLSQAADAALAGDLGRAEALTRRARAFWEENLLFCGVFFHQDRVEAVSAQLDRLALWLSGEDSLSFAAECLDLAARLRAMAQEHSLALPHFL